MRHTEGGIISISTYGAIFLIFNMVCRPDLITLFFTIIRAMQRMVMDYFRQIICKQ
jgi:hypothetical protein